MGTTKIKRDRRTKKVLRKAHGYMKKPGWNIVGYVLAHKPAETYGRYAIKALPDAYEYNTCVRQDVLDRANCGCAVGSIVAAATELYGDQPKVCKVVIADAKNRVAGELLQTKYGREEYLVDDDDIAKVAREEADDVITSINDGNPNPEKPWEPNKRARRALLKAFRKASA